MSNAELIRNLQEAMQSRSRPAPYDATAVVTRVDGATAWVRLAGSDTETPIKRTIDAKAGDVVQVRVSGGSAWINGNQSAPPTDDTTAIEVKQKTEAVERTVETTVQTLEKVADVANDAKDTAIAGKAIAEATDQYFWSDANGAHVALTPKDTDPNGATGFNSLWNMLGLLLRNGGNILAQFSQNGIAFYDGSGNNAANVLAKFGANGVQIGKSGAANINVKPDLVTLNDPDGEVALFLKYNKIITQDMEYRYGVSVRDENNLSYFDIYPQSDGRTFTGYLALRALMGNFLFTTPNGSYVVYTDQGFTYRNSNSDVLASVDSSGNIRGAGNASFSGNINASGNITAVGGITAQGSISTNGTVIAGGGYSDIVEHEDVSLSVSYEAGTIGTRAASLSAGSTVKSGYTYIGAYVQDHRNTSLFNATISHNAPNDTAHLCVYRATGNAVDGASVTVRKIWLKTGTGV